MLVKFTHIAANLFSGAGASLLWDEYGKLGHTISDYLNYTVFQNGWRRRGKRLDGYSSVREKNE
jgi:hypothetical protein